MRAWQFRGILGAAVLFMGLGSETQAQLAIHVATGGNDKGNGTAEAPFASLERARDAVRALKREKGLPAGGVRVVLHGGTYRLERPFALMPEDSGSAEAPVVYAAAPGETPVVSGGRVIGGFRRNADGSWSTTVEAARNRAWVFRQLFVDNRRYVLA